MCFLWEYTEDKKEKKGGKESTRKSRLNEIKLNIQSSNSYKPKDDNNNFIPRLTKFIEEYKTIKKQVEKLEKENKSLKKKLQKYENNNMCELCKIIVMMIN